jgi:hypothetical protein
VSSIAATRGNGQVLISTKPRAVRCTPGSGSTILSGDSVSCSWTAGNAAESLKGWTASGMSPASSTSPTPTFTALRAGPATLSMSWMDSHGQSQTFSYTVQ